VGERVDLGDGAGRVARCAVTRVTRGGLEVVVREIRVDPVPDLRLVLVQALAKGGRDEAAVEAAVECGVDGVLPWQARRSVVMWKGERAERGRARWQAVARAAAKQSRRAWVPWVGGPVSTAQVCELVAGAALGLLLDVDASVRLTDVDPPQAGDVVIVVGPEGGLDPTEVAGLVAAGAVPARLGPTVLRSSTAGPAALAVLSVLTRRW
jgi:16S rRNA (uracil1498-N3)-methyltransferase